MGREKCEKYPKNKRNLLLFGGEIQNLGGGGEISPLKALKKTLIGGGGGGGGVRGCEAAIIRVERSHAKVKIGGDYFSALAPQFHRPWCKSFLL